MGKELAKITGILVVHWQAKNLNVTHHDTALDSEFGSILGWDKANQTSNFWVYSNAVVPEGVAAKFYRNSF